MRKRLYRFLAVFMAMTMTASLGLVTLADEEGVDWTEFGEEEEEEEIYYPDEEGEDVTYGDLYLYPTDTCIYQGETTNAYARIDTNVCDDAFNVEWESTDYSVADVYGSGNNVTIRGNGAGSATIVATLIIGGEWYDSESFTMTVKAPQPTHIGVTGIQVSTNSLTVNKGDERYIDYTVYPDNASNKSINCYSSNTDIVRIENNGYFYAVGSGDAVLTFVTCDNGYKANVNIKVVDNSLRDTPITAVSVNPTASTLYVGQEFYITPTCYPSDAKNKNVNYYSSNNMVATVTSTGKVVGVGIGQAIITTAAQYGTGQAATVVNVVAGKATANNKMTSAVVATTSRSADFNYKVLQQIVACKKNGTVKLDVTSPMSFHSTAATALAARPDVKVVCTFPYNGVKFRMTIPKGYDLTSTLDKSGYVEWLQLCFKPGIIVEAVN